ncbi:hypothetical protein EMIHUDRAFT_231821 [Emiliania huxleyi CCMP1516]|uniref:NADP-dependent oxidoreductase domain-containing protein n=2 Tax=Emiliania huxleyi TaxID=2903 RepID=A0A0D3K097_EMIH1|nr:hypothetical protein EMIHUDRAFT_203709 [Emiliania huxleyi CCMP1516]XP_005783875.1 hypothetical protein EMIHUDRAFT_231821 [Emiliania huxleyi CCMP1516]EOD29182.1 hypothetical protein EMIHUDRAFT_203709 [Emiliania huxleyi CCMP1516]EOD31446.1 hypothetical protein EMIHUDRAFT_231821 [Emiliania huxleyi CCMP1516]|eukprot:XP_005781611.1 hypothetical protein EMIHUDRAFT_203709 [Emiliania huxleyi CCMP1516]
MASGRLGACTGYLDGYTAPDTELTEEDGTAGDARPAAAYAFVRLSPCGIGPPYGSGSGGTSLASLSHAGLALATTLPFAADGCSRDPLVRALAERHGASPAQLLLRWSTQLGLM